MQFIFNNIRIISWKIISQIYYYYIYICLQIMFCKFHFIISSVIYVLKGNLSVCNCYYISTSEFQFKDRGGSNVLIKSSFFGSSFLLCQLVVLHLPQNWSPLSSVVKRFLQSPSERSKGLFTVQFLARLSIIIVDTREI